MQDKQSALLKTLPVTVRVIEIGSRKMTASIFNQIPTDDISLAVELKEFDIETYIGWIQYKDEKYVLFTRNGILYKFKPTIGVPKQVLNKYEATRKDYHLNRRKTTFEELKDAQADRDDFREESRLHTELFKGFFAPDKQIYIL